MSTEVLIVVGIVLVWAVIGGFSDAGTLSAAAIASRALTPRQAILTVGGFGFLGPLVGGTAVAATIGSFVDLSGLAPQDALRTLTAGLVAAIVWNAVTWRAGLPVSSTHGLVGGLVGATIAASGADDVRWGVAALAEGRIEGVTKVVIALVVSPILGLALGAVIHALAAGALRSAEVGWHRRLRRAQVPAVAALSFTHGLNEAQKSMGIIALALLAGGTTDSLDVPVWAVVLSAATIPAAALLGGWRIVRTLGFGIYRLRPLHGASAQLAAASVVAATSAWGGPVSTSQVSSSAIMGVGASERPKAVRWETGKAMLLAWVVTIPCTIALAAALTLLLRATGAIG
mgnify:FL=1